MAFIIRSSNDEIISFVETAAGIVLGPGETLEETPQTFGAYSRRLRLSVEERAGELIQVPVSAENVMVNVDCPDESQVALTINGLEETIPLSDGRGALILSCAVPGTFVIAPAGRTKYCAAGEALCIVEVME